jgi:uncharacterized repeat protein (TIGR03803 family)
MTSLSRLRARAAAPRVLPCLLALLGCPALAFAQATPAVSTIVAFSGSTAANTPVFGQDGALYGVNSVGGIVTSGLIYRLATNPPAITTQYQIENTQGYAPIGGLLLGSDDLLYGTTSVGSLFTANTSGTVFSIAADGSGFRILHNFAAFSTFNVLSDPINADGARPETELVEGSDGFLYGTTPVGGTNGTGVVFKLAKDGSGFAVIHTFDAVIAVDADNNGVQDLPAKNAEGMGAVAPLLLRSDGYLYGVAGEGGANGAGTIFRLLPDGSAFEVLHVFDALVDNTSIPDTNADGAQPIAALVDGGDGRLYGVAALGGTNGYGTVFAFEPGTSTYTTLHDFDQDDGSQPTGELLLGQNGALYGTTAFGGNLTCGVSGGCGTIFTIARDGTGFSTLFRFSYTDGSTPSSRLLQVDGNTFIGLTQSGAQCGYGTVYQFSLTGDTVSGITNCGRKKKNNSGGGSTTPGLLLLLGGALAARRLRRR